MSVSFVLATDVGNSRVKFGLFEAVENSGESRQFPRLVDSRAVPLETTASPGESLRSWLGGRAARGVIAGSNPAGVQHLLAEWPAGSCPPPVWLNSNDRLPLKIRVDSPDKVGVDRLLNAVAVNVLRAPGQAVIIVDSGTATTVDRVDGDGSFVGGAILPGIELCARALNQYTAQLPLINRSELTGNSLVALGKNTRDAIRSGVLFGQIGAIRELVTRLNSNGGESAAVIVTGGNGELLLPYLDSAARFVPELTLAGLALAAASLNTVQPLS